MPTCVRGSSTVFLTVKYKLGNGDWQELPRYSFDHSWNTCENACPPDSDFHEGTCLSSRFAKPKSTSTGQMTILGRTINYELAQEEVENITICEYTCNRREGTKSTQHGKPQKSDKPLKQKSEDR
jgi:hypothetical protein